MDPHLSTHPAKTGGRRIKRAIATCALIAVPLAGVVGTSSAASAGQRAAVPRARVDLTLPTFSNPTTITNPLFPISASEQVIQLGAEGDVVLRHEITTLDRTKTIRWNGKDIETVVSQFVAYGDGELLEIATDYFAQADDGSVWYLGEHVTNYADGKVENHDGTWIAGKDGPAGMIMPANPKVGDVYRPENIPNLVFEEVTVKAVDLTVDGPTGPVTGAIKVQEELLDGTLEDKVFAPGYGEFEASVPTQDELVTVAVAVPIDELGTREPKALDKLSDLAYDVRKGARSERWSTVQRLSAKAQQAWSTLAATEPPSFLAEQMASAVISLDEAVATRDRDALAQAALDVEFAALDLELQYSEVTQVDSDRIGMWRIQRQLHKAAGETAAALSDSVIITAIRDRVKG